MSGAFGARTNFTSSLRDNDANDSTGIEGNNLFRISFDRFSEAETVLNDLEIILSDSMASHVIGK